MKTPQENAHAEMRLYDRASQRLYLNASERGRFLAVARTRPPHIQAFALTLFYTGCRLSEAREIFAHSIQVEDQVVCFRSLKKRAEHHVREVPAPSILIARLEPLVRQTPHGHLWMANRITTYRWIKSIMSEACIVGPQACPKGLRHSFGVHATQCGVPIHVIQKWMGHASAKTTAIYANVVGAEERSLAEKMW